MALVSLQLVQGYLCRVAGVTIIPEKLHAQKNYLGIISEMCNDIPCNRLHRKMFGELIAEELHRTLSHSNYTPASVTCFGELAGRKSESTCGATQVPKMHMANLEIVLGCVGSWRWKI